MHRRTTHEGDDGHARTPCWNDSKNCSIEGGTKKDVALLAVSAVALGFSFFAPETLPFNPAWIAIVLCGAPSSWRRHRAW